MEHLEIRRLFVAIFLIVQTWNIAWTQMCRQNNDKWYCLYLGDVTWADAQTACTERRARLAWDNSLASNDVLSELIRNARVSQAWIGGKTGPLYFNWINKDLDPSGVYYQGCYRSTSELLSQCVFRWSINQCKTHCNGFKYFSRYKGSGGRKCCCFNVFGMIDGGSPGSCSICGQENMPCGDDLSHRAIYMTSAQFPAKHIWKTSHPVGLTDYQDDALCMAVVYDDTSSSVRIEDKRCTEYHYPLCILDEKSNGCKSNEFSMFYSRKCLAYIRGGETWESAGDQCRSHAPKRHSELSSFASYDHFLDLELVMRTIVIESGSQVFWTSGSSRRWVWEDKDEKPTIPTTIVHATSLKTETTKRLIDTTPGEQKTNSVPPWSIHITSYRPFESSASSFTTEYSGPDSEPQSADHTIPVVAGVGSVVGLIILTAAVVLLMCWQKRRRMTDKGSGTVNVNVGFSSTTGVDLPNQSDNVYNDVDHGDYTTIAGTGKHTDLTENVDCTGEHVYESALCSGLPNVVKDHIQNTSPEGIVMNDPDRGVRRSTKNVEDGKPNLNPVTETPGDVSVLYSVPKKDRKKRPEKNQQESNPIMTKRAESHKEKRQTNPSQTSDQGTECAVYAVPKKRSKRSEVTADGNTPDSVYAYAADGFAVENVNENTDNADYYNLIISQKQQRNIQGSPPDDVEDATTLVDNDIYNT